ncbi:MAG: choice-of-anchor P family protein [Methanobacteriota archaeon]
MGRQRVYTVAAACLVALSASTFVPRGAVGCEAAADPTYANARGSGFGLRLRAPSLVPGDIQILNVTAKRSGPGDARAEETYQRIRQTDPTGRFAVLADLVLVRSTAVANVSDAPLASKGTVDTEIANVTLLDGLVTANAARAIAVGTATPRNATFSTLGSVFASVTVRGTPVVVDRPWVWVDLSKSFGAGSYVMFYERWGYVHVPQRATMDGFSADVDVNAIHVVLRDIDPGRPGDQGVDLVVGHAFAHADFPMEPTCIPVQRVIGEATVLRERTAPSLVPVTVGFVEIGELGGHEHQAGKEIDPANVWANASQSDARGAILGGEASEAQSFAEVSDLCIALAPASCSISATVVRSDASARAEGYRAWAAGTSRILGLKILGVDACTAAPSVPCTPAPNTVRQVGDLKVVLNEQIRDDAAPDDCDETITVRAIHMTRADGSLDVVVGESVAGALCC